MTARQRVTSDTQYGIANPMLSAYVNGLLASATPARKSWSLGALGRGQEYRRQSPV